MQFSLERIDRWRYARVAGHCTGAVLDIGCGRQILRTYLAPGATYLGVDLEFGFGVVAHDRLRFHH